MEKHEHTHGHGLAGGGAKSPLLACQSRPHLGRQEQVCTLNICLHSVNRQVWGGGGYGMLCVHIHVWCVQYVHTRVVLAHAHTLLAV